MDNKAVAAATRFDLLAAIRTGIVVGIASALTSIIVLTALHVLLPSELWDASAAAFLGTLSTTAVFLLAVVVGPLFETLLGQVLPIETARQLGANALGCVALSAGAFGTGHYLNGGLAHGVTAAVSGGFFAWAYVLMRKRRWSTAFTSAFTAHATHNVLLLFVLAPVFPSWA